MIAKYYINDPASETHEIYDGISLDNFLDEFYYLPEEKLAYIGLIDRSEYDVRFSYIDYDYYLLENRDSDGRMMYSQRMSYDECVNIIKTLFKNIAVR